MQNIICHLLLWGNFQWLLIVRNLCTFPPTSDYCYYTPPLPTVASIFSKFFDKFKTLVISLCPWTLLCHFCLLIFTCLTFKLAILFLFTSDITLFLMHQTPIKLEKDRSSAFNLFENSKKILFSSSVNSVIIIFVFPTFTFITFDSSARYKSPFIS